MLKAFLSNLRVLFRVPPAPYLEPLQALVPGFSSSFSSALPAPDVEPLQAVVAGFFSSIAVPPAPDLEPLQADEPDGVPAQPAPARSPAMLKPARIFFSFCLSIQTPFLIYGVIIDLLDGTGNMEVTPESLWRVFYAKICV